MSFLNIFIAILGLALLTAAKTSTVTFPQPSPIYCSAPNHFIQFSSLYSTCTLFYLPSLDNKIVELFAYDDHCVEIGHVSRVGTEKDYAFHTQLKDMIILNFDIKKGAEVLVLSYWHQRKKHIVTTEYTTRCFESTTENGGTIGCEMMFECLVPLSTPKRMSARSIQTSRTSKA